MASSWKLALSTIKGYISALRLPLRLALDRDILGGPVFTAFMKGLSAFFPVSRPSVVQWNLEVVLDFLGAQEPMGSLSPLQLYRKTLFLVAITSARRVSELAHLGWRKNDLIITHQDASISYLPNFIAKNETPSNLHRRVRIEKMSLSKDDPDKHVCPVRALLYWRDHLRSLYNPSDGLFQFPTGCSSKC